MVSNCLGELLFEVSSIHGSCGLLSVRRVKARVGRGPSAKIGTFTIMSCPTCGFDPNVLRRSFSPRGTGRSQISSVAPYEAC